MSYAEAANERLQTAHGDEASKEIEVFQHQLQNFWAGANAATSLTNKRRSLMRRSQSPSPRLRRPSAGTNPWMPTAGLSSPAVSTAYG